MRDVKNDTGRAYALAITVLILFLAWGAIAAKPWAAAPVDPKVAKLQAKEKQAQEAAAKAKRIVDARWAKYKANLKVRQRQITLAQGRHAADLAEYRRKLVFAEARRPRVVRYVSGGGGGSSGGRGYTGGSSGGGSSRSGGGSAGGGGGGGGGAVAAPPAIVSAPPVTSTKTS